MKLLLLIGILLSELLPIPIYAQTPVVINDNVENIPIGPYMEYCIPDKGNVVSLIVRNQLSDESMDWKKINKEHINLGLTSKYRLFRFLIKNDCKKQKYWYLDLSNQMLSFVILLKPMIDRKYKIIFNGNVIPLGNRDIPSNNIIFHMDEISNEMPCYLYIQETLSPLSFFPVLQTQQFHLQKLHQKMPIFWIFCGVMIAVLFYNLVMLFFVKDICHIYLVCFIGDWIMLLIGREGYNGHLTPPISFFECLSQIFLLLFIKTYINTRKHFPVFEKVIFIAGLTPCYLYIPFSIIFYHMIYSTVVQSFIIYIESMLFSLSLIAYIKGLRQAKYVLTALFIMFICAIIYYFTILGFLPSNFFTEWIVHIGSTAVIVIFTLGLANNIEAMKYATCQKNVTPRD
jgi:adenylate cyclase